MICVVLCGGAGSRLWPLSREEHPKPFITLPNGRNLIQEAYLHAANLTKCQQIITVTNSKLYFKAEEAMQTLNLSTPDSYILEPFGRNTAPAITVATLSAIQKYDSNAIILVLAADHIITDQLAFESAVNQASQLAEQNFIVTFGLKPTHPDTGFGYIEANGNKVLSFIEKPDLTTARQFFEAGNFYWNAGLFCFKAGVLIDELEIFAPEILKFSQYSLQDAGKTIKNNKIIELDPDNFILTPNISLDYAVLEKSHRVAVVPCDLGWSDIGTWSAMANLYPTDENNNHIFDQDKTLLNDVNNCDIYSEDRLVACLGIENTLIVDTPDAILVANKDRDQDIKILYQNLKDNKSETYLRHRTVYRPWGSFTLLGEGPRFKIKRLIIKPGGSLSLQMHHHRSEHWVVVSGSAEVTCDNNTFFLDTNESTYIKAGHFHRVSNKGLIDLIIIEVQSGDYLEENDIVRSDDIYGRI